MKKKSLFIVLCASFGLTLGMSSCNKCVECTTTIPGFGTSSEIYCKPENYTTKAWNRQLEEIEDEYTTCENLGL